MTCACLSAHAKYNTTFQFSSGELFLSSSTSNSWKPVLSRDHKWKPNPDVQSVSLRQFFGNFCVIRRCFKGLSFTSGFEIFYNKCWMLIVFIILRINFITGMFLISWHNGTLNYLTLKDLELLLGHFWMIQAVFNEMNIKVVKRIYFG